MSTNSDKSKRQTVDTINDISPLEFSFNLASTEDAASTSLTTKNLTTAFPNNNSHTSRNKHHHEYDQSDIDSVTSDDMGHALHSEAAAAALLAREELVDAVDFFVQWKDSLIQVHPLPNSSLLPLLTTSSKLLRCRDVLKNNIRTLAVLAQSFAKGLLSDEHLLRLKSTSEACQLELGMEKMRRVEATRKLTSSLALLRRYRDELKYVRWYRLMLKLLSREKVRTAEDRVQAASSTITTLRSQLKEYKKKCHEMESLQKATSQVAIANQTRADVLERKMKKSIRREKKLTDQVSSLTNDHASLQKTVDTLEKKDILNKKK